MSDRKELLELVERLRRALEEMAARGLRLTGPRELEKLSDLRDELGSVGAASLSASVERLSRSVRASDPGAAADLLRLTASVRVFERLLSRGAALEQLRSLEQEADRVPERSDANDRPPSDAEPGS